MAEDSQTETSAEALQQDLMAAHGFMKVASFPDHVVYAFAYPEDFPTQARPSLSFHLAHEELPDSKDIVAQVYHAGIKLGQDTLQNNFRALLGVSFGNS